MEPGNSTSLVCSADVAAFVDALETINCNEAESYEAGENVVICISEPDISGLKETQILDIDEVSADPSYNQFFNSDTRRLKAVMQQLVLQKKAVIVKKSLINIKGNKQFKSDVWNWFGDVRMFISESDAKRLNIPYYMKQYGEEQVMMCKVFVGCFKCSAIFMYDAQRHSTSTLRYHVRACTRPKECIFVSDDKMDDDTSEIMESKNVIPQDGGRKVKRFRTDPRKQKEVIEQLFQKQKAVVTRKSFMNIKGNRRFKSDVWNWFGDIKLLISRSEAKKLKIPYYIRRCGDEQIVLSKIFVGCFKCLALFIHDSQKSTSTLRYHIRTCSRPKERKKRSMPNIIFFPNKKGPKAPEAFSDCDAIPAHEKLMNFTLSTESSFDVIKDPEFQKILQLCISIGSIYGDVNIDSLLCATPTLTSFILNDLYVTSINEFYTEFQHSYGVTYKLSIWIDEQVKCPFVSVYCSYINSVGELKNVIIHTDDFDFDSKNADNLKDWFHNFLSDQPVIPFKRLIITDNESNIVTAFKDELTVKCSVQNVLTMLQMVATRIARSTNSELPDVTNLLTNCVDIVDYFEQVADQYQLPEELVKCTDDKWTSILALFRSIDEQYENILNVLNETGATHLLSVEKTTIKNVVEFFKVFEDAIIQLSSSSEPTLNLVIPWIVKFQKICGVEHEDPSALKQLKSHTNLELSERIVKVITVYHRIATFLDPRFKKMAFGPQSEHRDANLKVKCLVKECLEYPNMEELLDGRKAHIDPDRMPETYSNIFDSNRSDKVAIEEVDKYLAEPFHIESLDARLQSQFPVLKYWTERIEMYPNLSKVALWILSCPANSAQDNDTYWSNNWLVNCPKLSAQPANVNKLLFVKSYRGL